jgi:hypothetical protein
LQPQIIISEWENCKELVSYEPQCDCFARFAGVVSQFLVDAVVLFGAESVVFDVLALKALVSVPARVLAYPGTENII